MNDELLLRDEVYAVIGAAIEVHKEMGSGYAEGVYQESMEIELTDRGIPFEPQKHLQVFFKGRLLKARFVADAICYAELLVELKAIDHLTAKDKAQMLNYLKTTGLQVGVLINFGYHGRLQWKRLVLTAHGPLYPDEGVE